MSPTVLFPFPFDVSLLILLALSTLLAEDLTCLAAGTLVAAGRLGFAEATLACLAGIVAGDLALFALGRIAGRRLLNVPGLRSRLSATQLERASDWLMRRGALVAILSRFTPGTRLPVYLAAGALKTNTRTFLFYLILASALWVPLVVGAAALSGKDQVARWLVFTPVLALPFLPRLLSWNRRRSIVGFVRSFLRWEFWPVWLAYVPVLPWILLFALRHRSLTLFTAANPGIPTGGLAGESKSQILEALQPSGAVAPFSVARAGEPVPLPQVWPVVLKPDVGERGNGVVIARGEEEFRNYFEEHRADTIVQEYVPGLEFGVLYCRRPGETSGAILSITEKRFPHVVGDAKRSLRELILADSRAVCLAPVYLRRLAARIDTIPSLGEQVTLVDIGSHCKGAVFVDGRHHSTPALLARLDQISGTHSGFFIGRYDVRTPSAEHLRNGQLTVIELNGVAGEPTHIYDPAVNIFDAYRALYRHWQLAFEIGAANRACGHAPMRLM